MSDTNVEAVYALSPMQEGLLFHTLLLPGEGVYSQQIGCSLHGAIDTAAFRRAWEFVLHRHSILRTAFLWQDIGSSVQVVHKTVALPWRELDWRNLGEEEQDARWEGFLEEERRIDFHLNEPPLMRLTLIQRAADRYYFCWTHHHLLLDGWSGAVLMKEVALAHRSFAAGRGAPALPPAVPYANYIAWLQRQDQAAVERYWRELLAGFETPSELRIPSAAHEGDQTTYRRALRQFSANAHRRLREFARRNRLTVNTILQGAWALLVNRYSGEQDVVFGVTSSGRPPDIPGVESMVGLFVATMPLRVNVDPFASAGAWLDSIQRQQAQARQHEHYPLVRLQLLTRIPRGTPLFESILVFESYPVDAQVGVGVSDLGAGGDIAVRERISYPLTVAVVPGAQLTLRIGYEFPRFEPDAVERMLQQWETLALALVARPESRLQGLSMLTQQELNWVVSDCNRTTVAWDRNSSLRYLLRSAAERWPERPAVTFEGVTLDYRTLDARADRLARRLEAAGVGPDRVVAVSQDRSIQLVVTLLAVLKAGGAYLPLDPDDPPERRRWMFENAGAGWLVVNGRDRGQLAGIEPVIIDAAGVGDLSGDDAPVMPRPQLHPAHLAYVLYTSGTTGKPKGAMIPHAGICNRLLWMQAEYRLNETDAVLQKTPYTFDVSLWEFFWPLLAGARLVMARPGGHKDAAYLASLIREQSITTVHFVPSMLHAFLEEDSTARCTSLRRVISSGEPLRLDLVDRFHGVLPCSLHNLYGPTEASVDVTYHECARHFPYARVPIGRPIANTSIHILDHSGMPVPVGVPGELHIGGISLARGYVNMPDLTAQRFIPDPFSSTGDRLYRTGDLARRMPDGGIEYLERMDAQVKIRGFRVEPGEIEMLISAHEAIAEAAVAAPEAAAGDRRLTAAVTLRPDAARSADTASLRRTHIEQWSSIYDDVYSEPAGADPSFHLAGWTSSYTGRPIPPAEMREWLAHAVERALSGAPRNVLEIGCGNGLVLFQAAPRCGRYIATDISRTALDYVRSHLDSLNGIVDLRQQAAHDMTGIAPRSVDLVLLNSVVQYFPDAGYLLEVLERAASLLRPGGKIFIGDVRNLSLLAAFHAGVELLKAPDSASAAEVAKRSEAARWREEELAISPRWFSTLYSRLPSLAEIQVLPKRGHGENELTRFRFDVLLGFSPSPGTRISPEWIDWREERWTISSILEHLLRFRPNMFALSHVANARLSAELELSRLLEIADASQTAAVLRNALRERRRNGISPEEVFALTAAGYRVDISWVRGAADGSFDLVLQDAASASCLIEWSTPILTADAEQTLSNRPLRARLARNLNDDLRERLSRHLPAYMVPASTVILDEMPRTASGKLDRKKIDRIAASGLAPLRAGEPPRTLVEKAVCDLCAQVLGRDRIGIRDNFFEFGGHSLLATQLVSRLRAIFKVDFQLRALFDRPQPAGIAASLEKLARQPDEMEQIARVYERMKTMTPAERAAKARQLAQTRAAEASVGRR